VSLDSHDARAVAILTMPADCCEHTTHEVLHPAWDAVTGRQARSIAVQAAFKTVQSGTKRPACAFCVVRTTARRASGAPERSPISVRGG